MFVSSLNITEYRGIKSCKNPIEFTNFSILLGKNSSGKSTILEALSLLPIPNLNNYFTKQSKLNYIIELHKSKLSYFKKILYLYAGNSILEYQCKNINVKFEFNENRAKYIFNGQEEQRISILKDIYQLELKELEQAVLFIPHTTSIIEDLEREIENLKELITKKGLHIELANFLNKCVNDKYSEIVFLDPISLRKVYDNNTVFIQLRDLGTGAEKVTKIMALLSVLEPKLVLIDDFEAGLHPSLIKLFLKWLKNNKWQTIISTHSIDVLYYIAEIKPEDASILLLNKSNEDILSYEIFTLNDLEDLVDANTDPRFLVEALSRSSYNCK
ncbi:MAG: ATP-dependent nuclease [Promethearchaeota archaeon]